MVDKMRILYGVKGTQHCQSPLRINVPIEWMDGWMNFKKKIIQTVSTDIQVPKHKQNKQTKNEV